MTATFGTKANLPPGRVLHSVRADSPQGKTPVDTGDIYGGHGRVDASGWGADLTAGLSPILSLIPGVPLQNFVSQQETRAKDAVVQRIRQRGDEPVFVSISINLAQKNAEFDFLAIKGEDPIPLVVIVGAVVIGILAVSFLVITAVTTLVYGPTTRVIVREPTTDKVILEFEGPAGVSPREVKLPSGEVTFGTGAGEFFQGLGELQGPILAVLLVTAAVVILITFLRRPS